MILIRTKYHGAGNYIGSRISADDGRGHRVYISYDHSLSNLDLKQKAADELMVKMGWDKHSTTVYAGTYKEEDYYMMQRKG